MSKVKDKEERRIKKVKISMMRNPMFALWQGIMMIGKTSVVDGFPTAATNGRDEMYGREFIRMFDDKSLAFIVAHENLHKGLRHLTVYKNLHKIDPKLANQAMDYVINLMLVELDPNEVVIAMPRAPDGSYIGLLDKDYKGMGTKQVFDILREQQESGGGGGGGSGGEGFDEHDWDGASELSPEEVKELAQEVDTAIRQGQIAHTKLNGKGGANMGRDLQDLMYPEINWKEALREFVTSTCANKDTSSWRRINRRLLPLDIYMPSLVGESVGNVVFGADTSGSVSSRQTTKMVSETQNAMETVAPERLDMLYWDSYVEKHEVYTRGDVTYAETTKPTGGGGTEPRCVISYLKEKKLTPDCVIMLTDGYIGANDWGSAADWGVPVLWVILDNRDAVAPCGKTVHVTSSDFD